MDERMIVRVSPKIDVPGSACNVRVRVLEAGALVREQGTPEVP